ncbi:hypothetical protein [Methyloraptor flagellatus]|uniref:Uncharacterized protein n=1 Tax=Methyloraptor flagellatus TaxID=3162530 RepID=A0AAU7X5J0_9HYPH
MAIGSIGSSFGTIAPQTAVRETAQSARAEEASAATDEAEASRSREPAPAGQPTQSAPVERLSSGAAHAAIAAQEAGRRNTSHQEASRAYSRG